MRKNNAKHFAEKTKKINTQKTNKKTSKDYIDLDDNLINNTKNKNKKLKKKIPLYQKILLLIFIAIFIFSAVTLIRWYTRTSKTAEKYENLARKVVTSIDKTNNSDGFEKIDFDELKKINSDIVGWIKVEGTNINYPIMQTNNNNYYLTNDIYNRTDSCGSIYMDYKNDSNFTDKNTVIYGHHIKRGIMFARIGRCL